MADSCCRANARFEGLDPRYKLVLWTVIAINAAMFVIEIAAGHIAGATNILYSRVAELAPQLPHDQPIVLYCIHSAHRAPEAAATLRKLGFSNTAILEGGIVAWQADGRAIHASDLANEPKILPLTARCKQLGATTSEQAL